MKRSFALLAFLLAVAFSPALQAQFIGPAAGSSSITLTTSGTSGAATLISGVLNIPNYSGGGINALTGDVTASGTGSVAATVAAIQGVNVVC